MPWQANRLGHRTKFLCYLIWRHSHDFIRGRFPYQPRDDNSEGTEIRPGSCLNRMLDEFFSPELSAVSSYLEYVTRHPPFGFSKICEQLTAPKLSAIHDNLTSHSYVVAIILSPLDANITTQSFFLLRQL